MRIFSGLFLGAAALIASASGCGGATSDDGRTGGTGGGVNAGGIGGGVITGGTGGIGGTPSESPCNQGCYKLANAGCPVPYDFGKCSAECQSLYGDYPQCIGVFDNFALCALGYGKVTCEDGEANLVDFDPYCNEAQEAFFQCFDGGSGGSSGFGGTAGMGGSGGVPCGPCSGWKLHGLITMKPCCTLAGGCGALSDSTIKAFSGVPEGCHALNQAGALECSCPPIDYLNPVTNQYEQHPGCCHNGTCGVWVDFTKSEGPNLGCVKNPSEPPIYCAPKFPPPCSDAG